ncbi:MAG: PilT/PilU family type 4a pilus ATPase [Lachnospiraceae bacterium]|nr:PilT/PilU family type 4a pilus ATPase [Lachnospiraceae bacterium]
MLDLKELLRQASNQGASDVHISAGTAPRFRIHGRLIPSNFPKMTSSDTLEILLSLMNPEKREQFEKEGGIDLSVSIPDTGRYRVNAYKQRGSISLSLRVVDMVIPDTAFLQIPDVVTSLCQEKRGLVFVTGPSGSGKSTVLASLINEINLTRACNIITLEDPIEYLHSHRESMVNQREIGLDASDYPSALTAALREDPDVLQVSRLESMEEIFLVIQAAEAGRLVFSSMYTLSAAETVENLLNLFREDRRSYAANRVANALKATVTRQLIPSLDGDRVPAYEILIVDNEVRDLIRKGRTGEISAYLSRNHDRGMITMDESILSLLRQGKIREEDALQAAADPEQMKKSL